MAVEIRKTTERAMLAHRHAVATQPHINIMSIFVSIAFGPHTTVNCVINKLEAKMQNACAHYTNMKQTFICLYQAAYNAHVGTSAHVDSNQFIYICRFVRSQIFGSLCLCSSSKFHQILVAVRVQIQSFNEIIGLALLLFCVTSFNGMKSHVFLRPYPSQYSRRNPEWNSKVQLTHASNCPRKANAMTAHKDQSRNGTYHVSPT